MRLRAVETDVGAGPRKATGLMALVCPHAYCGSIYDLNAVQLKRQGIDGLIVDVDNTLVQWDRHEVTSELREWFEKARDAGISCCIVSNSTRVSRIAAFARELGVQFVCPAAKPMPSSFRSAMRRLGTAPSATAVVGDQVFTDILGGNIAGLRTILVQPVSLREFAWTRLLRRVERVVLRRLRAQGLMPPEAPNG